MGVGMGIGIRIGGGGRGGRRESQRRAVLFRVATSLLALKTEDSETFYPAVDEMRGEGKMIGEERKEKDGEGTK